MSSTPDARRALSFGAIAATYDTYRPSYPPDMFAELRALLPGRRVLEVGAGTGKATVDLARLGLELTCLEPDPGMVEILRAKYAEGAEDGGSVTIEVTTFEDFEAVAPFDAIMSAQAWHWTDPATRWDRAARLLEPGGIIALFWNEDDWGTEPVHRAVEEVYARHLTTTESRPYNHWQGNTSGGKLGREIDAHPAFEFLGLRTFARRHTWTADGIAGQHQTQSLVSTQPADIRDALHAGTVEAVEAVGGGRLTVSIHTKLYLGRRL